VPLAHPTSCVASFSQIEGGASALALAATAAALRGLSVSLLMSLTGPWSTHTLVAGAARRLLA
jgi:hypothetical protein